MTTLDDVRGAIDEQRKLALMAGVPRATRVRISNATLQAVEDHMRHQELESARKSDLTMGDFGGSDFEAKKLTEHLRRPYATTGDQVFGLRIEIDDTLAEGDVRVE